MFEEDLSALSTADLLESAAEHRAIGNRADARVLEHAQIYADRFHPDACPHRPARRPVDGRERAVVLGGDGCPPIAEFAIAEFGVMLGISPQVAAGFLGQALALRHRFPFTWARVQAGDATPWKARQLAETCQKLPEHAARYVDKRVAPLIDAITPYRLAKIIRAAKMHADPALAHAETDQNARERGVFIGRSDDHGTKTMYIKAPAAAVIRNNATLDAIADALKTFGDTRPTQHRRATAIGIIADPLYTQELLTQARTHHTDNAQPAAASPTTPNTAVSPGPAPAALDPVSPALAAIAPQAPGAGSGRASAVHPTSTPAPVGATSPTDANAARTYPQHAATQHPRTSATPAHPQPNTTKNHITGTTAAPGQPPLIAVQGSFSRTSGFSVPEAATALSAAAIARRVGREPDDDLLDHSRESTEPGPDDEADREAPHPSSSDLPDPLDHPGSVPIEPFDPGLFSGVLGDGDGEPMDPAAVRALHARLEHIKRDAYTKPTTGTTSSDQTTPATRRPSSRQLRPGQTEIYVHLTDHTLATGTGVLRAEGIGPLLATQLTELVGHSPYTVKPVIDLNDTISVDAYEIPDRIRERIKLIHPVEQFPYGTRETTPTMDLDHIQPYNPDGPPGQTNTTNLAPLGRFPHRVKTHAHGWKTRRLHPNTLEWTTPHGFLFEVGPTGTRRVAGRPGYSAAAVESAASSNPAKSLPP